MGTERQTRRPARRAEAIETPARIVAAAEQLFAKRGIDAVSLVEIGDAAGQRNRSAVQYHFGGKDELLAAIHEKHAPGVERRRKAMLDELEARGRPSLRSLVEVLVLPVADKVLDPDGGEAYVRINAARIGHPRLPLITREATRRRGTTARLFDLIAGASPSLPRTLLSSRMLLVTGLVFHGIADYARLAGARRGDLAWRLHVGHLVDCVLAVLRAPVSRDTEMLLQEGDLGA